MSVEKIVLNPVSNVQNVISNENLVDLTSTTCNQLTKQLLDISGPYARNSFIMRDDISLATGTAASSLRQYGDGTKTFTKDGRKTLNMIEYASPAQRYIKDEIVARIGERIDHECSDGTTSSMIYTISFLMYMMKNRDRLKHVSTYDIEFMYNEVMTSILERMQDKTVTVSNFLQELQNRREEFAATDDFFDGFESDEDFQELDIRRILGYIQAYTSSSGNRQIAEAVSTVISKMPVSNWGDEIIQEYSIAETKDSSVHAEEYDYEIMFSSQAMTAHHNNKHRGTSFKAEGCHLLVLRDAVIHGSMTQMAINSYVQTVINDPVRLEELKAAKYLVLIIPGFSENYDPKILHELFIPFHENGVKVFITGYLRPRGHEAVGYQWYRIDAISAKANVEVCYDISLTEQQDKNKDTGFFSVEPYIIKGANVSVDRYYTKVSNLIDWSKVSDEVREICELNNTHPGDYEPEKYKNYTDHQRFIIQQIDKFLSRDGDPHEVTIKDLKDAHTLSRCIRPWVIKITGKSRDQQMLQYIIDDAAGAAIQALRDGVQFNGPIKLVQVISDELQVVKSNYNTQQEAVRTLILCAMFKASTDMVFSMFGPYAPRMINNIDQLVSLAGDTFKYLNIYQHGEIKDQLDLQPFSHLDGVTPKDINWIPHRNPLQFNPKHEDYLNMFIKGYFFEDDKFKDVSVPPCQVGNLIPVLLDRVREVCLRFVCTSSVIAPRTIWDDGQLTK